MIGWLGRGVLAACCVTGGAVAGELGGRPFSDPAYVVPMSEEWRGRGITHMTPEPVDLVLAIDQQLHPAIVPLVEEFAKARGVRIAMQEGTCGLATGAAADKAADVAGYCCPPGDLDRLPGLRYHTLGIGALALIAHRDTVADGMSLDQARKAFGGQTRDWSELPVSGVSTGKGSVRAVARLHCKVRPTGWQMLLRDENLFGYDITQVPAIRDMIETVAATPGALGYETLYHVAQYPASKVKVLKLDGIDPRDAEAVAAGRYPLFRVFSVSSWAEPPARKPLADALVRHLLDNVERIDPAYHIVPVTRLRAAGWAFHGDEVVGRPD